MGISRFEDIEAWQLARALANRIYDLTSGALFAKDYGLKDQVQRAAGSAMHNIAEGFDADSNPEFVRFLGYAKRSCTEVQSEMYLALDRNYVSKEDFDDVYRVAARTRSAIHAFMKYLKEHKADSSKS